MAHTASIVDAVTGACSQICVHLSEPLYDLVLNMVCLSQSILDPDGMLILAQIYDYASNNVRANAVRAIHQLVECVANANPQKTLAKFFSFCEANIKIELENGASSLRTTSDSMPLPSDTTLHWSMPLCLRF
jgi:proteasome activator subunit 4